MVNVPIYTPPNKWTIDNLSATFDRNRVLKINFTTDFNKLNLK